MQIGQFDPMILVIIVFWCFDWFDLQLGVTESWPRHCHLAVATSQNSMIYTTIGQSILPETAFPAETNVDTPIITQCFIQLLDSLFYRKLHFQLKLMQILLLLPSALYNYWTVYSTQNCIPS
jgi:hypothetical protein